MALALSFVWLRCVARPTCGWLISHNYSSLVAKLRCNCAMVGLQGLIAAQSSSTRYTRQHLPPQCFKLITRPNQTHHLSALAEASSAVPSLSFVDVLLFSLALNRTRLKCARAFSVRMIEVKNKTGRRDCAEESVHPDQLLSSAFPEPDIAQTPCLLRLQDGIFSEDVLLSEVGLALTWEFAMLLK